MISVTQNKTLIDEQKQNDKNNHVVTLSGLKRYHEITSDRYTKLQARVEYLEKICSAYFCN